MQFFTLGSSNIEDFEPCFHDIVTTRYDHPRYVKHVLGTIYVFFTLFGYHVRGGGGPPKDGYTTCFRSFSLWVAPKLQILNLVFCDTVIT